MVNIILRYLGCLWLLIFVVSSISLILSSFLSSRFFIISVNSSGLFLLQVATYTRGFSLMCLFGWYFSANSNTLSFSVVEYPLWVRVVSNSLRRLFLGFYP